MRSELRPRDTERSPEKRGGRKRNILGPGNNSLCKALTTVEKGSEGPVAPKSPLKGLLRKPKAEVMVARMVTVREGQWPKRNLGDKNKKTQKTGSKTQNYNAVNCPSLSSKQSQSKFQQDRLHVSFRIDGNVISWHEVHLEEQMHKCSQ